jgi:Ca2+-binding EF-hand superfamily protein
MKTRFGTLAAVLLFSPLAGAQNLVPAGAESVSTFLQFDSDHDGAVSRREAQASPSLKTNFERLDLDGNGKLTADEMSGYGPYSYPGGDQSASTFLQFDSDGDWAVSRREAEASPSLSANFFRLDLNGDGKITMKEMPGYPFALHAGDQSASTFLQFDSDRDGAVSRIEAGESPSLSANFSRLDRNRDGEITADEMTVVEHPLIGALGRPGIPAGSQSASTYVQFDADHDGVVSRSEAQASASLRIFFDRLDSDRNGVISADEMESR